MDLLLADKSDALVTLQQFFSLVKTQVGRVIKVVRTENSKELHMTQFI